MSGICVGSEPLSVICRSARSTKGEFQSTKYINESYLTTIENIEDNDPYINKLAYLAEVPTCCNSRVKNVVDPRVYVAKTQLGADPDSPTFHQAMNGDHAKE